MVRSVPETVAICPSLRLNSILSIPAFSLTSEPGLQAGINEISTTKNINKWVVKNVNIGIMNISSAQFRLSVRSRVLTQLPFRYQVFEEKLSFFV